MALKPENPTRERALEGKTEREQLEILVHFALADLSNYFKSQDDPLRYEVNCLWHKVDHLRRIPEFPRVKQPVGG